MDKVGIVVVKARLWLQEEWRCESGEMTLLMQGPFSSHSQCGTGTLKLYET